MTIPFTCPHCGQHTAVDPKYAGRSGPCVSCGKTVVIPLLDSAAVESSGEADSAPRRPWWIGAGMIAGGVTAVAVLVLVVVTMLRPVFQAARDAARCSACESNLKRISLALEDYYVDHGHYPPAVEYGDNGQPQHSWRVLLLPYLGPAAEQVHELYDFAAAWNAPQNARLVSQMPNVYQCPSDTRATIGETSYLAVIGPNTVLSISKQPTTNDDIADPRSETLVVIESAGSTTNWMQPKDVSLDQLRAGLNSANTASPGSNHTQGVHALMVDGSIARLPDITPPRDLRAMSTIDGREFVETLDDLEY